MDTERAPAGASTAYAPGAWRLLCGPHTWLLADPADEPETLDELWQLVDNGAPLATVLRRIESAEPGTLPAFALVHLEPGAEKVALRGSATVRLETPTLDPVELSCPVGVTAWIEHPVSPAVETITLATAGAPGEATLFPVRRAVVLAALVVVSRTGQAVPTPVAEPVLEQVPEPEPVRPSGETLEFSMSEAPPDKPDEPDEPTEVPSYDHLFAATQVRTVAGAAVHDSDVAAEQTPAPPEPEEAPEEDDDDNPRAGDPHGTLAMPVEDLPLGVQPPPMADGPLIASVPGVSGQAAPGASTQPSPPMPEPIEVQTEIDDLTVKRPSLEPRPPRPPGPTVQAVHCPAGHANPPHMPRCRVCNAEIGSAEPITVPRPVLGVLRLSTGDRVALDRGAIFGRSPFIDEGHAQGERPHVVRVPSPSKDISRNHLEVQLDGWHVVITDLDSTNGTLITAPGQEPLRLAPGEQVPIAPGTTVSLAGEVTFVYEAEA